MEKLLFDTSILNDFQEAGRLVVAYDDLPDEVIIKMNRFDKVDPVTVILLNAKILWNRFYQDDVRAAIEATGLNIMEMATDLELELKDLLLAFLDQCVVYGHCDPEKTNEISLSDLSRARGYAMWIQVYGEREDKLASCGEPQPVSH